jgi:hypothetical protein
MEQIPYGIPTNIWCHHTKCSSRGELAPEIRASLLKRLAIEGTAKETTLIQTKNKKNKK